MATGQAGGLGGVVQGFAGSDAAPKPKYFTEIKRSLEQLGLLGRDALRNVRNQLNPFADQFAKGTEQQRGFMGEQEDVLRNLQGRNLAFDPLQFGQQVGNQLFGYIDPNVINPLSRFDVNQDILTRRARGLNPSARDSTAERLRNARIASGRYYDVARNVYNILPQMFQQMRNAGVGAEQLAAGALPQIMQGYRQLDLAPLIPLQAGLDLTSQGAGSVADIGNAIRSGVYGYHKKKNVADRFGDAGTSMWNTIKDAAQIYASLYGGGAGGLGGSLGGGGGGAGGAPAYGSVYPGYQGNPYYSVPNAQGGGMSAPIFS